MSRQHALLSASSASKWLNCTPSAKLESKVKHSASSYADEGTLAHDLAENELKYLLGFISNEEHLHKLSQIKTSEYYNESMEEYVNDYVDYCLERYNRYKSAYVGIEETVNLEPYIKKGFSHLDFRLIGNTGLYDVLEIIDLKYGKGVPVQAENNKQGLVYALGAYLSHSFIYDIQVVRITIFQPRIENITHWDLPIEKLLWWADNELIPKAKIAYEGKGELQAGEWCRFCKVKHTCRAFAEMNLKLTKLDFEDLKEDTSFLIPDPNKPLFLSSEEISLIIKNAATFKSWIEGILEYALKEALNGREWPGLKLVHGRSMRRYTDPNKVIEILKLTGYKEESITNKKILAITELEKLIGKEKLNRLAGAYIDKPEGKPSLVLESDNRPTYNKTEEAIEDFKDL